MTTDTLVTTGPTDTAAGSTQTAPDATADTSTGAQPDAQQQQQGTDATATGDKPAEGTKDEGAKDGDKPDGDKPDGDKPTGAPEQYEDFKAPEGVALDAEVTGEFKALAKELNLPQEQAQKVADLGVKMAQKWQAEQAKAMSETVAKWADDTRADKDIGGDKLDENLATAKKALDSFGSPQLKTLLNESGLGNHPEVIRLLLNAGKAISEDRFVPGKAGHTPVETAAQRMYPNMNP